MPIYTLKEIALMGEQQHLHDQALIRECVGGLTLYATRIAQADKAAPIITDIRAMIETLISYWSLDNGDPSILQNNYLQPFDLWTTDADIDLDIRIAPKQRAAIVNGLFWYCEDMATCMGFEAKDDILSAKELMIEIAPGLGFEPDELKKLTEKIEFNVQYLISQQTDQQDNVYAQQMGGSSL